MGVFAPLTGVIGAMQAMEAIKLLAGIGETLNGKLQVFDAKSTEWRSVRVKKDPACSVCGKTVSRVPPEIPPAGAAPGRNG